MRTRRVLGKGDGEGGRMRVDGSERVLEEGEWPEVRLLDLRKAYASPQGQQAGFLGVVGEVWAGREDVESGEEVA